MQNDRLIIIKAPPGTKLDVPDPDEGMEKGKRRYQIFLKSAGGPIEAYLVEGEDTPMEDTNSREESVIKGFEDPDYYNHYFSNLAEGIADYYTEK